MKTKNHTYTLAASLIAFGSLVGGVNGATSLFSDAAYGFFNNEDDFVSDIDSNASNGGSVSISGAGYDDFYQFNGNASASADFTILRAQGGGNLDDVGDGNGFFVDSTPDFYHATGFARYSETLSYGGTATNYNSKYILNFTGIITGDAFAVVTLEHANQPVQQWFFDQPGTYNETLISNAFIHGLSPQDFTLSLQSSVNLDTTGIIPVSGNADFGNTLEVIGVELRDNDTGELLTGDSVTGESGSTYAITQIPEPSSLLLFGLSGLGLALRRSRL